MSYVDIKIEWYCVKLCTFDFEIFFTISFRTCIITKLYFWDEVVLLYSCTVCCLLMNTCLLIYSRNIWCNGYVIVFVFWIQHT